MARKPKLCIDRVVPDIYNPARATAQRALVQNAQRMMRAAPAFALGAPAAAPGGPMALAVVTLKLWENGRTLKCRFLNGSTTQRKKVEDKAHLWEDHCSIKFKFVETGDAEIRISFGPDTGSWSAVGTDALIERYFPRYQPTMNYGWLEDNSSDDEYSRVVVHEFGHALGAIHEHQNPSGKLPWNVPEVYRVFSGAPNFWTKAEIDHNVLNRYSKTTTNYSAYDPDSIMLYAFPAALFTSGSGTKSNRTFSAQDKLFIGQMYPKRQPSGGKDGAKGSRAGSRRRRRARGRG